MLLKAQEDTEVVSPSPSKEVNLLEQIKEERKELAVLEEEISYFYNLLQQRNVVRKLYKKGKVSELEKVFLKNSKVLDRMFKERDIEAISLKIGEQKIIYNEVVELKDYLIFYRAKLALLKNDREKAQFLLEDLVNNYPQSTKLDLAVAFLKEVYFFSGKNEELIEISNKYPGKDSIEQNYWLGHAYYNIGNYDESISIFNILKKDKEFGFRSQEMLALIAYFTDGIDASMDQFLTLQKDYNTNSDYYDFIILSLARLYIAKDENEKALEYYEWFDNLQIEELSDEILYEIATQLNNCAQYNKAISFLIRITQKPIKSEYFTSAKFLIAISEQGKGNLDQAESTLDEIIINNNILLETMNTKYRLLAKYGEIRRKISRSDISDEKRNEYKLQSGNIEEALSKTNKTMNDLYAGLDRRTLSLLELLEEEYLSYSSTIADIDAIILLANTVPNKRIPALIDREIAASDSSIITLQILRYLSHKQNFTYKDYNFARALAEEKIYQNELLKTWDEIEQIAKENKHEEILPAIESSRSLITENLESIDVIARYVFKGKPSDDFQEIIHEEAEAIEKNRDDLLTLKKEVIENFNKQIAKRLNKEKEVLVAEFETLSLTYDKALSLIMDDINNENDKYKFSLLGVLFKQTQIMDDDYKQLQERVKNE